MYVVATVGAGSGSLFPSAIVNNTGAVLFSRDGIAGAVQNGPGDYTVSFTAPGHAVGTIALQGTPLGSVPAYVAVEHLDPINVHVSTFDFTGALADSPFYLSGITGLV